MRTDKQINPVKTKQNKGVGGTRDEQDWSGKAALTRNLLREQKK
jgi:hypothetical protein